MSSSPGTLTTYVRHIAKRWWLSLPILLLGGLAISYWYWKGVTVEEIAAHGRSASVVSVCFASDGNDVIIGWADGAIQFWSIPGGRITETLTGHPRRITSLVLDPDGSHLYTGSADGVIEEWDLSSRKEQRRVELDGGGVFALAVNPNDGSLAVACRDKTLRVWNAANGHDTIITDKLSYVSTSLAFSSDGKLLASGKTTEDTACVWNLTRREEPVYLRGHPSEVDSVVFLGDSHTVATGSYGTVKLWDADTGTELGTLRKHIRGVSVIACSSSGRRLATGDGNGLICLWDTSSHELVTSFQAHTAAVRSLSFSPDGKMLASGCTDIGVDDLKGHGEAKLWRIREGYHAPRGW